MTNDKIKVGAPVCGRRPRQGKRCTAAPRGGRRCELLHPTHKRGVSIASNKRAGRILLNQARSINKGKDTRCWAVKQLQYTTGVRRFDRPAALNAFLAPLSHHGVNEALCNE